MISSNSNYLQKDTSPYTIKLRVRASIYEIVGIQPFSLQHCDNGFRVLSFCFEMFRLNFYAGITTLKDLSFKRVSSVLQSKTELI